MRTSTSGLRLIEQFEGFSSVQYRDSVGVATIGYGTTAADITPLPVSCTRQQAEGWLAAHLASKYEPAVNTLGVPLNQNQFDALVSLAYNVGPGVMGWQIGIDLKARNYQAASGDFMHYVYAGGQVLQGLVNRRRAEQALFNTPPPPPPDPFHYGWYNPHTILVSERHLCERNVALEYDRRRRHPILNARRLRILRGFCSILAGRCKTLALEANPPAWHDSRHLRFRHDMLEARAQGRQLVP